MPAEVDRARLCIAVIGDLVGSREIADREAAQHDLVGALSRWSKVLRPWLATPFRVSAGDEFQGLLISAAPIPDLVWRAAVEFTWAPVRFGFGRGELTTALGRSPTETDGPAWWHARTALQAAESSRRTGGVFSGFGEDDIVLTGFATLLQYVRSRLTQRQRDVLNRLREGEDMVRVAEQLRITRQAVHRIARAAGWRACEEGEAAWRAVLSRYDYSGEWRDERS